MKICEKVLITIQNWYCNSTMPYIASVVLKAFWFVAIDKSQNRRNKT